MDHEQSHVVLTVREAWGAVSGWLVLARRPGK